MLEYCKVSPTSSVYITGTNYLYEVTDEELVQKAELPYKYEPTDMLALGKEIYGISAPLGGLIAFPKTDRYRKGLLSSQQAASNCVLQQKLPISFT